MTTNLLNAAILTTNKLVYSIEHIAHRPQLYTVPVNGINAVTEILDLALQHNLHTVWVQPGCSLNQFTLAHAVDQSGTWDIKTSTTRGPVRGSPEILKSVSAHRREGTFAERRRITIAYPELNAYQWTPDLATDPVTCLAALHYGERALGVPMSHNPGLTGRDIMEETNASGSRPLWIKAPSFDLSTLPTSLGYDLAYLRGLDPLDLPNMEQYVLSWDKNSQYIAACTSAELPTGNPVYVPTAELANGYDEAMLRFYDARRPGFWHIEYDRFTLPTINPLYPGQEWVTTPLLKLLYSLNVKLMVREAWVWPEHHRWLDRFANVLWLARQSLKTDEKSYPHAGGRKLAEYSMKRIATSSVGLLANQEAARIAPQWYRPEITKMIVEDAKCRIYYKVLQVQRLFGSWPIRINVDEVTYLTLEKDPTKAFPGMFDRPENLGGWKLAHALPANPAVLACFKPGLSAGKSTRMLNEVASNQVTLFSGLGEIA